MPKVAQDVELQTRLNEYLQARGISVPHAATEFGVDRVSLWRFCATGKARRDKRAEYRDALDRAMSVKSETAVAVAHEVNRVKPEVSVGDRELRRIRQACESVLKLLDAYEGNLSGSAHQRR